LLTKQGNFVVNNFIFMTSFGDNLKRIRNLRNISQGELAQKVDMHATHISRYERNVTAPSIEILKKLAEALEVTVDELIYGSHDNKLENSIRDNELIRLFKKVQILNEKQQETVKDFLNAFLFQKEMQQRFVQ
jgi:transcriptional regulator with XRE-family HTH domain